MANTGFGDWRNRGNGIGVRESKPHCLLDDARAREIAQAAGLKVWGTLKILLEAKSRGLTEKVEPLVKRLTDTGMWISDDIRQRILALAGEK